MYNKTYVYILISNIYNHIYIKQEIGTLTSNIDLSPYYIKTETDTLLSNICLSSYYIKFEADDIDNELSTLILNTCTKTEVGTPLYASYPTLSFIVNVFYSKTEIGSTLGGYTTSAQLHTGFYSKVKTNLIFDTCTTTTQLYMYTYIYIYIDLYSKGDIDTLLADTVSKTGNVSLPGHLDIGTTYRSSRIRCNAELGGYTGYAELKAANSYDMFLNLSTTRTDGGWMYFVIHNDSYMPLSANYNKVNITTIFTINKYTA